MEPRAFDPDAVMHLLSTDPHRPLAHLSRVPGGHAGTIEQSASNALVASLTAGNVDAVCVSSGDHLSAAMVCRRSEWDSANFGVDVLRSDHVAVVAGADRGRAAAKLGRTLLAPAQGARFVVLTIDSGDVAVLVGLQRAGFKVYDSLLTFAAVPGASQTGRAVEHSNLLEFDADALSTGAAASSEEIDRLARLAPALFKGSHLFADARLPTGQVNAAYDHWVRAVFRGEWSDYLVVSRDSDGSLASFVSFARVAGYQHGSTVMANSFGFSVPPHRRGHTTRLTARVLEKAPADLVISVTQGCNLTQVNGLSRGGMTAIRSSLVLHGWTR